MAEQPIKSSEIIENGLFDDAIKQSEIMISKLKELQVQQVQNLTVSKEYIASFSGKGSKALSDLSKETVKVNATLEQYEKTQLGLIEIEKQQAKLKSELSKATREELKLTKDLAKEEANRVKNYNNQNSEYKKASDNLRDLKKALKDLSIAGKEDTKEFKELNKQFEELDKRVRKADNSVGDFQRNVGNYPKQLKEMQKALMDLEPGTEEFIRLSKEAGLLKDKISDAKDATKAFATESKATTAKNLFGQIGNDLADLDFKGAAEKASTFASVVRSITFAEVTSGLKAFGAAILDVGKALLLNPFTAIAAGVAGLVYITYDLITTFSKLAEQTATVNEALAESQKQIDELTKKQLDYLVRIRVAQGKLTKEQGDNIKTEFENNEKRKENARKYAEDVIKLAKELDVDLGELQNGRFNENDIAVTITGKKELEKRKAFNRELRKLEINYGVLTRQLVKSQVLEKVAIEEEAERERLEKIKEAKDKSYKELKEKAKKEKDEQDKIDKEARDREADAINREADRYDREKAKEKAERLQNEKDWQEALLFVEKDAEKTREEFEKKNAEAKKLRQEQELKNAIETSQKILDSISNEIAKESELRQKGFDKQISDTQKNIETQRKLAEKGAKNTLVEEEANKVKLERQKEIEKQQEIKRQKALAFFKLFSSYADKDPNTALQKALRDTVIAEAVSGAFIDGTENVERDLKGNKVHNGTDGYVIAVDGRERILNPEQNEKIGNLSNEALADLAYKHNNGLLESAKFGVMQSNSFADNIKNSALLMETVALRKEMQDIKQAIKSRPISNFQFDGYGDFIKTTIEDGFKKTTRYKQNKPRI